MIPNTKCQIPNANSGFTLIELLITIFLVSIGLIGAISFFNSSLRSQFDAKNEVIAAGLAQEGTELVRNIVDYNFLKSQSWWSNVANTNQGNSNCSTIDYISALNDHECLIPSGGKKTEVLFDNINGRYRQAGPSESGNTGFFREISIEGENIIGPPPPPATNIDLNGGDCLSVTATVGWPNTNPACNSSITNCPYKTVSTDIICKPRQ